ncbi:site-specific DNA-methyltransferase [Neobacillus mesonae]|nr:site-specific DNA-methyltransferase [Neobacillus mesonae]
MAKIEPKIFDELKIALSSFGGKYLVGEELNRSKLTDDLRNYDEALLSKLFEVEFIKQHVIKEVAGQKLFQIEQLEEAILYNNYWDTSYTKYENRVGLASKGRFLQDSQDVVLDFPFKDGVLTASMTKEDNEDGYDDAFLNEVIEKDEIDRLFDRKILANVKRYGKAENSILDNEIVSFDKEKDNLVIKGNNLLALHTLKDMYAGQIKLIYIDPPYNTGKDSFRYNDNFKKSTWLTFMKNRLEVARELLTEDGVLIVQIDDKMQAQLKLLLDDVMGEEQFETTFHVQVRYSNKTLSEDNDFQKVMEVAHVYSYDTNTFKPSKIKDEYSLDKFSFEVVEKNLPIETIVENGKKVDVFGPDDFEIRQVDGNIDGLKETWATGSLIRQGGTAAEFLSKYLIQRKEIGYLYKVYGMGNDGLGYRYIRGPKKKGATRGTFFSGVPTKIRDGVISGEYSKEKPIPNLLDNLLHYEDSFGNNRTEGGVDIGGGKKPESLLQYFIEYFTNNEGDLVLDFFGGSGTTAATAMKMRRRFITSEQIEGQLEKLISRLQNVINKDQTGISKEVDWQGGGSFVYAELFPKNMGYLQDVIHSKTIDELKSVYERMLQGTDTEEPADISFRADLTKIDWAEGFDENKRLLVKLLDKNGLYYNYSEIEDKNVRDLISDEDYAFNKAFYEGGE